MSADPTHDETDLARRLARVEAERDARHERCKVLERELADAKRRLAAGETPSRGAT